MTHPLAADAAQALQGVTDLIARLEERAESERAIQANNEAVATALRGQKLLFDQGFRSPSITFAMRLGLDHENCAKNDAALAADWDEAAAALTALSEQNAALAAQVAELTRERDRFEAALARACLVGGTTYLIERAEAAEAKVARLEEAFRQLKENATGQWVPSSVVCAIVDAALTEGTPE